VDVAAWCGRCGGSFPLVEVIADAGAMGRCPRCAEPLGEGYSATVVPAIRRLLTAAETLRETAIELQATAPSLHIDDAALAAELGDAFGRARR
jgi:hypothetical protein